MVKSNKFYMKNNMSMILCRRLIFLTLVSILTFNSCVEVGNMQKIGDGFSFGYFENSKSTSNVYYNSAGIFHGVCNNIKWNSKFILVNLKFKEIEQYFLVNKAEYIKQPKQMESKGVIGPIPKDSIDIVLTLNNVGELSNSQKIQ